MRDALLYKSQMHFRGGDTFTHSSCPTDRPSFSLLASMYVSLCACVCVRVYVESKKSLTYSKWEKNATRFFPNARAVNERRARIFVIYNLI